MTDLRYPQWGPILKRLATDFGISNYENGAFSFRMPEGPEICIEPLENSSTVVLHASVGRASEIGEGPHNITYSDLLASNSPYRGRLVCAIDPVDDHIVLFERFDDCSTGYEDFCTRVEDFASAVVGGVAALTSSSAWPTRDRDQDPDAEQAFRRLWSDYRAMMGWPSLNEDLADGGFIPVDGADGVIVSFESRTNCVLLKYVLALLPIEDDTAGRSRIEATFRLLLQAHLFAQATDGACFAADVDESALVLYQRVPLAGATAFDLSEVLNRLGATGLRFSSILS